MSVDLAHHEIFRAKVGKGGIKEINFVKLLLVIDYNYCSDIGLVARVLQPGETQSSPISYIDFLTQSHCCIIYI